MTIGSKLGQVLPHGAPADGDARYLLYAIRRMAAQGLRDAHAAQAMLTCYGLGYRAPLALLRALLADMAETAEGAITVAPCCHPRMTTDERNILSAVAMATDRPCESGVLLAKTLGTRESPRATATARALGECLRNAGRPLRV